MKNKMKRRMISLFMCLTMLSSLLPTGLVVKAQSENNQFQVISKVFEYGHDAIAIAIDAGAEVNNATIDKNNFTVHNDAQTLTIKAAYTNTTAEIDSAQTGTNGNYIILELDNGYSKKGYSLLSFSMETFKNTRVDLNKFTVTQSVNFEYADATVGDCTYELNLTTPEIVITVDEFEARAYIHETGEGVDTLKYRLYTPEGLGGGEKVPLVLWLHGRGEGGNNTDSGYNGVTQILANMGGIGWVEAAELDSDLKAFVVAPQAYDLWDWRNAEADRKDVIRIDEMLKEIIANNGDNIDTSRIYIAGCSMGGGQTFAQLIYSKTETSATQFAAAFPICPAYVLTEEDADKIKDIPMTIFQSKDDTTVSPDAVRTSVNKLLDAGSTKTQYIEYTSVLGKDGTTQYNGHWSWVRVLNNQDDVMQWLFDESRAYTPVTTQLVSPKITSAVVNEDKTVTLEWETIEGADKYNVYKRVPAANWWEAPSDTKLNISDITETIFTTSAFEAGSHTFIVTAIKGADESMLNSGKSEITTIEADSGSVSSVVAPTITLGTGWLGGRQVDVTHPEITQANIDAGKVAVYYTLDGSVPTASSLNARIISYFGMIFTNIAITQPSVMKVIIIVDGVTSDVASINVPPSAPTAMGSGVYLDTDLTQLKVNFETGAKVYYTTGLVEYADGEVDNTQLAAINEPTVSSAEYTVPVDITGATQSKAFVIKTIAVYDADGTNLLSPISTFYYVADPTLEKLTENNIDTIISEMTLKEKVDLLSGIGMNPATAINNGVAGSTYEIPRLGIPATLLSDGPAGVRMGKNATCFMSPTGIASTWSVNAMKDIATRTAVEAKHYAVDIMLAPALNIQRNPMGGRDFEYYSEDPIIAGTIASAYTSALQESGVGVSLKHFAANNQEDDRMQGEVIVSERALREIYLRGFEMAVDEAPWTFMGSYNKINSILSCSNPWLMTTVLRDDWGFDGYVMSDWGADYNPVDSVKAQMDLSQPKRANNSAAIFSWINESGITDTEKSERIALVERSVKNILKIVVKTPSFKGEYDGLTQEILAERSTDFKDSEVYTDSKAVNRATASEGMVLLKNDGTLPLATTSSNKLKVALVTSSIAKKESLNYSGFFGDSTTAIKDLVIEGGGSAQVIWKPDYAITLEQGLINGNFDVVYNEIDADVQASAASEAAEAVAVADVGIFVLSRTSSEGADNNTTMFDLSATEKVVFDAYADAFKAENKKFIVLINAGASVNTTDFNVKANAILDVWLPGTEGGNAIADILGGIVNPSGKLTQTFPVAYNDSSSIAMATAEHTGKTWATNPVFYDEGVYVGYRYFDTFNAKDRVAYSFGHGLSYTNFEFSDLILNKNQFSIIDNDDTIDVSVKVTNTGSVAGKEVVQLYLGASTYATEKRPVKELKHYAKTSLLAPGTSETVTFTIVKRDLQYFDDNNLSNMLGLDSNNVSTVKYGEGEGWTVKNGTIFTVTVGNTSENTVLTTKGVTGEFTYGTDVLPLKPVVNATSTKNSVILTWNAVDGETYKVSQKSGSLYNDIAVVPVISSGKATATISGLSNSTNYIFRVTTKVKDMQAISDDVVISTKASSSGGSNNNNNSGGNSSVTPTPTPTPNEEVKTTKEKLATMFTDAASIPNWAEVAIADLISKGIISGRTNGTFDPNGKISRAEFIKLVVTCLDIKGTDNLKKFEDVEAAAWYKSYIDIATSNDLVNGIGANNFAPDNNISRQDLCVIIYNALKALNVSLPEIDSSTFTDNDKINDYAKEASYTLKALGIVNGRSDGSFDPLATATRAEASVIIKGILDYIAEIN